MNMSHSVTGIKYKGTLIQIYDEIKAGYLNKIGY